MRIAESRAQPRICRNLQPLRGFYYVARLRSFTKAAEAMGLDQSTVSLQVKLLETELETGLFERVGRRIELSADGRILFDLVAPVIETMNVLPETFAERRHSEIAGTRLRIAAVESVLLYVFPEIITVFLTEFPKVNLDLIQVSVTEIAELVKAGAIDFGITFGADVPPDLIFADWFVTDSMVVVRAGHPLIHAAELTFESIVRYPFVFPDRRRVTRVPLESAFTDRGFRPPVVMEAGGTEVIKRYVRLGLGISVLPGIALAEEPAGIVAIPASHLFGERQYGVVARRTRFSRAGRRFLELMSKRPGSVLDLDRLIVEPKRRR